MFLGQPWKGRTLATCKIRIGREYEGPTKSDGGWGRLTHVRIDALTCLWQVLMPRKQLPRFIRPATDIIVSNPPDDLKAPPSVDVREYLIVRPTGRRRRAFLPWDKLTEFIGLLEIPQTVGIGEKRGPLLSAAPMGEEATAGADKGHALIGSQELLPQSPKGFRRVSGRREGDRVSRPSGVPIRWSCWLGGKHAVQWI